MQQKGGIMIGLIHQYFQRSRNVILGRIKERIKEMSEERICGNCIHIAKTMQQAPCTVCYLADNHPNWEPTREYEITALRATIAEKDSCIDSINSISGEIGRALKGEQVSKYVKDNYIINEIIKLKKAEAELADLRERMKGIEEVYGEWKGTKSDKQLLHSPRLLAQELWQAINAAVEGK
jgi:hypothetical protein